MRFAAPPPSGSSWPSSSPSSAPSISPLTHAFLNRLVPLPDFFPFPFPPPRVGDDCSPYPYRRSRSRSSVPGVAAVLQLPGLDGSSLSASRSALVLTRGGIRGWNSRGVRFARAMSSEFIVGGGVMRRGEVLPGARGGDGGPFVAAKEAAGREGEEAEGCGGDEEGWGGDEGPAVGCPGKSMSMFELEPAGPDAGLRPSRNAFAISAAFHFAYFIFSSDCVQQSDGCIREM